jgi:CelD/BcsL family acetyltransferase involved in cellulose biosynthesis
LKVEEIEPSLWTERLGSAWDSLLKEVADSTIFLSFPWIVAWWRHFSDSRQPRMLAVWDDAGSLGALAPLYTMPMRLAGAPGPTVLALMGDEGVGSEYLGILVRRGGGEEECLAAVAKHLQKSWSLVDFRGLREESPSTPAILRVFAPPSSRRVHRERHPCSRIELPGDYEAYLASLPQKFRSTVRYRTNKLVKHFTVRMFRTQSEVEVTPHLERFFAMHQDRWTAEGHPGSFYGDAKRAFYEEVSREFLRRGWLRFYHLEVDGIVRASQFGFVFNGILHSLQEAFDHDFRPPGVGGVGVVLRGMAIRDCIGEGIRAYDFLGGIEDFKTRWGTRTHYVQRVRIGAPGLAGALAFAATAGVREFKDWGKEHSPAWLVQGRDRLRSWRRVRRARQVAAPERGAEG